MPSGSVNQASGRIPEDEETIAELCLCVADRRRGGADQRVRDRVRFERNLSARNLLAGTQIAGVVTRLGVGRIEPTDAPVKSGRNRDLEGVGKHPLAEFVVAADIAAHGVVGQIIDLRLQRSIRIDDTRQ